MDPLPETFPPFSLDSMLEDDHLMSMIQSDWEKNFNNSIDEPITNLYPSIPNPDKPSSAESPLKITLTFTKSGNQKTIIFGKPNSAASSTPSQLISFGNSSSSSISLTNGMEKIRNVVKAEPAEIISFKQMDFSGSSSSNSSSSSSAEELQQWDDGDDQCFGPQRDSSMAVKKTTRTPLQAKYHVIAERKRREKLLDRFRALSDMIPSLKKLDKMSIINGAINSLKDYEKRIKDLEQKLDQERRKREHYLVSGHDHDETEEKPCLCDDGDVALDYPQLKKRKLRG